MPSSRKLRNRLRRIQDAALRASHATIDLSLIEDMPDIPACCLLSLEACVALIIGDDGALQRRATSFFERYRSAIEDLRDCPLVERLVGLKAFGVKADPRRFAKRIVSAPYDHDRWIHSIFVTAHACVLGLSLNLTEEELARVVFAALLHDIGHPAYSHDGDDLLVAHGFPPHETRGQRRVMEDLDIRESLACAGLQPEQVVSVMREEGALGYLLSIADTLGYLVLDSEMIGQPLGYGFSRRVIQSILGVDERRVQVTAPESLQELLDARARLSRDIYYHPANCLAAASLRKVLRYLEACGHFPVRILEDETDTGMEIRLTSLLNDPSNPPPAWVMSAWCLAHGLVDRARAWETQTFASRDDVERAFHARTPHALQTAIVIEPHDYTRKRLRVCTTDGREMELRAPAAYRSDFSKEWHTLVYALR